MNNALLELKKEFNAENNKKFKFEAIIEYAVYGKEANNQMPDIY